MRSITISELQDWGHCRTLWGFRHVQYLRPLNKAPNMVSGSVVHAVINEVLGGVSDRTTMELSAFDHLMTEFNGDQELTDKYLAGVNNALSKVPEWVWGSTWHSEERLTLDVHGTELRGRPDLFSVSDDVLDIVEFKTTDNDPLDYLLFNPQTRYYAVMLNQVYPGRVIRLRYVCLPTQGKKVIDHMPWVLTSRVLNAAKVELERAIQEIGQLVVRPNYGFWCKFCEFNGVCMAVLTGADPSSIIKEQFIKEE